MDLEGATFFHNVDLHNRMDRGTVDGLRSVHRTQHGMYLKYLDSLDTYWDS